MSSKDELQARELAHALDDLKGRLGDYPRARAGSKGWTDGYPTRSSSAGEPGKGSEISRPVERAVIAALEPGKTDRASGLHHELHTTIADATRAVHDAIKVLEFARSSGAVIGKRPPGACEQPGCLTVVTGIDQDRLKRFRGEGPRLCPADYKRHEIAAKAAGITEFAHTSESTDP